ncbi:MAG: bifunctional 2-C-methyl-D-erythritol 4-phosphate cytidylyltransferase/2-C-methyl-D-erythritol 2,4-cyclodiphosphate synthase [Caulobacteraceae bacterium]
MEFTAIVVAAGSGSRAGNGVSKQWRTVAGKPVARWSVEAFFAAGARTVVVVVPPTEIETAQAILGDLPGLIMTPGGATRAQSVINGLAALSASDDVVMVHDAARPFLNTGHIQALLDGLKDADGAILALPVADTVKRELPANIETAPRDGLWRAQTPQAFRTAPLNAAYAAWSEEQAPTDDAGVMEAVGGVVRLVPGDPMLFKLTYPEDFAMAERLAGAARITRTGQGIDAHRLGPGDGVWLCGIKIASDRELIGHSDADAGLHAITDAILGAIGEGDIGDHFPPTDPQWKGAPSHIFLAHAAELIRRKGGALVNVDVTLVCEKPKIKPHRQAMREKLAEILGVGVDRISVKATTTEGMGYTGREEGILAQAVASVETPA